MFCPFCRREAASTEWNTPEQIEHINSAATAEMARLVQGALHRGVSRTKPTHFDGGFFKVSMSLSFTPDRILPVVVAQASEAMRQDFACEACACRYASLGASFFCPTCGHNSATSSFGTTLTTVERTVRTMDAIRISLTEALDPASAHDALRQLVEDQFARLVGAFERVSEALFDRLPNGVSFTSKGAVFQRIDDASTLWRSATGTGFEWFLSPPELERMKLLFQRRHVLSHRQGIVGQAYVDRSGDRAYAVGQRLVVRDDDVLELVRLMRTLVAGLRTLVP